MTYDQIVTLDAIVKQGSFKAAAEFLHKSQPSLSVAIKKLEEEFNFQIFDRAQYRPKLTSQGKKFYQKAQLTLDYFHQLETMGKEIGTGFETEINICVEAIFPIDSISSVLEGFFEPQITTSLNLKIDVLDGVMAKLENQEVDFALAPDFKGNKNIERVKIMDTTIVPVIAAKHKNCTIDDLKRLPQIVVPSSVAEKRGEVHGGGISNQFWYTSDLFMKEQIISSGLGWGRLPFHQIQEKLNQKKLVEIKKIKQIQSLSVPLYLMRLKNKVMGPNTKSLWEHLSKISS